MDYNLLQKLKNWRRNTANLEDIAIFQVFTNKTLEDIAELKPTNREELLSIKGIRDRKFTKYGEQILDLINNSKQDLKLQTNTSDTQSVKPLSVSAYLDFVNQNLVKYRAKIQGEISSIDPRDRVIYFSLKDRDDDSVINCLIWKRDYEMCGIMLEVGKEVILGGYPDIYKPNGRFSFKASSIELVGEGALKKAYDALKSKLEKEGLFDPARKRVLPKYPHNIGIITSRQGAVLGDFLSNIGKHGFNIKLIDSRVEGAEAIPDLLSSIKTFKKTNIEVLIIMRGGGSFEALQAFNNELLVKEIVNFPVPVIAAIGHDKDVPLISMAADLGLSTPSMAVPTLNQPWEQAKIFLERKTTNVFNQYMGWLGDSKYSIQQLLNNIITGINDISNRHKEIQNKILVSLQIFKNNLINFEIKLDNYFQKSIYGFSSLLSFIDPVKNMALCLSVFPKNIEMLKYKIDDSCRSSINTFSNLVSNISHDLLNFESIVSNNNPERQLNLGYSIVTIGGKVIKSIKDVSINQEINVKMKDGNIISTIKNINK